jgi:hypothetical protein
MHSILRRENLIDEPCFPIGIQERDMESALSSLMKRYIIIECEYLDGSESDFYIGLLSSLSNHVAEMKVFDSVGRWLKETRRIECDRITQIHFDTPYINTIKKYIE